MVGLRTGRFTRIHWTAAAATVVTAAIHLYLGVQDGIPAFTLAGVGFLVGLAAFFTTLWRRWFYLVAVAYVAAQVFLWAFAGYGMLAWAIPDKVAQLVLATAALYLYRQDELT